MTDADARDFDALFARTAGPLRLWARQWLDAAGADDAAQEAFVRLLGQRRRPDDPAAWLFTACRRICLDQLRRQKVRQRPVPAAEDFEPADAVEVEQAVAALTELPDRRRQIVVARLWGGLGFAAVGKLLGLSTSTAHAEYHAALAELRRRLDPEGGGQRAEGRAERNERRDER